MNREEKIEAVQYYLETKLYQEKTLNQEIIEVDNYIYSILKKVLKFLYLSQRTIEALEVGDIIVYKFAGVLCKDIIEIQQDISYIEYIKNSPEFNFIDIIPHEFLEMWGVIND